MRAHVCSSCGLDFDPTDSPAPLPRCPDHGVNVITVERPSALSILGVTRLPCLGTEKDWKRLGLVEPTRRAS